MHFSLTLVIAIVLAWGVLGLYCYCRERRRNQWRAVGRLVRRYAELDRALARIWECR
jgi:hypothetical protein